MFRVFLLLSCLILCAGSPAHAQNPALDAQNYRHAFALVDDGQPERAAAFIRHGRDPILNKVLEGYVMALPGNGASFGAMATFIGANPGWPNLKGILAIAEQKIPTNASAAQVASWFAAHPPVSLGGFYRAVDAFGAEGQMATVKNMVRVRWINGEFMPDELMAFRSRFERFLDTDADWARLDRCLWKNDSVCARAMYVYASPGMKAVAEARLALASQNRQASDLYDRVPREWKGDPGLLYERLRWHVKNKNDDEALDILQHAPDNLGRPELWWDQRHIMIRRAMEKRDYRLAYDLAIEHGQTNPKTLSQGEFMAGWLALRFLTRPDDAVNHFQALYDNSSTPISRARGAYWLGRTYEALDARDDAEQAYESAAALNITYYGQLAATRIYKNPVVRALPEPAVPPSVRRAFFDRDIIRAVERLHEIGENDRTRVFFRAAIDAATQRADFVMLTELAYQIRRPDLAIEAAKAANQKNMLMAAGGFPLLDHAMPRWPEPAFIHALIRQESMFNPDAESSSGAHGLMQLMPQTAKAVAAALGIRFRQARLVEPEYNLHLGTTYIQNQLAGFDGSYILALAGYNAGPHRVREWMQNIGDPRSPAVDPIDWVEEIPVDETRNYVQRIIESLQMYRARLSGGQAPLKIMQDLRR